MSKAKSLEDRAKELCASFRKSAAFKTLRVGGFYEEFEKFANRRGASKQETALAVRIEKEAEKLDEASDEDWDDSGEETVKAPEAKHIHVDDFIDGNFGKNQYARWFFFLHRLAAVYQLDWSKFIRNYKLFCTYGGERYRVTGASRMGDVWITKNFEQETGYEKRVFLEDCSNWSSDVNAEESATTATQSALDSCAAHRPLSKASLSHESIRAMADGQFADLLNTPEHLVLVSSSELGKLLQNFTGLRNGKD